MQYDRKSMKLAAKRSLSGRWLKILLMFAILFAVYALLSQCEQMVLLGLEIKPDTISLENFKYISSFRDVDSYVVTVIMAIATLVLVSPLITGIKRFLWNALADTSTEIGDIFYIYSCGRRFFTFLKLKFIIWLRILIYSILLFIPSVICFIFADGYSNNYIIRQLLLMGGMALIGLGAIFMIVIMLRYFMCDYIFIVDDSISVRKNIKSSCLMMKGMRVQVFVMGLSFIGWYLLCITVFPLAYVVPYSFASFSAIARVIMYNSSSILTHEKAPK